MYVGASFFFGIYVFELDKLSSVIRTHCKQIDANAFSFNILCVRNLIYISDRLPDYDYAFCCRKPE